MSYHAYNMPPPVPVDPTDVTGKRVAAWFIDAVVFVVVIIGVMSISGYSPEMTNHSEGTVREWAVARDLPVETADQRQTAGQRYCQEVLGFDETGVDGFARMCAPVSGDGVTVIAHIGRFYALFGILAVVFMLYQGLLHASLGKLAVGLRIVKADGRPAGVGASVVRTLLWVVDAITCAVPLVGGILIFTTKGHRRVGDMAAGTYVVPASQVGHPVILPGQPGWGTYQSGPPGYGPPGSFGAPGVPVPGQPPGTPTPWAPASPPPGDAPGGPAAFGTGAAAPDGGYEADKPIWDDARNAYIQYDTEQAAWLEYDDSTKEWKPIST